MYLAQGQQGYSITSHPGSRTTSWFTYGNQVNAANLTGSSLQSAAHWYFISALEAWSPAQSSGFVLIGDSITDGRGSDTDKNDRWPDLLLARMQNNSATKEIAVLNQAAGGNRILADGLGPNVLSRIDRDVLAQSGVKYALIFEGVNDIGVADATQAAQTAIGDRVIAAYKQVIARVHAQQIPIFGCTITPFSAPGYNVSLQAYSSPIREATRQRVNDFIRNSGAFDAVVDFDAVVRDPANPQQLAGNLQSGDYLHPNEQGYQMMANAFPLADFQRLAGGVEGYT